MARMGCSGDAQAVAGKQEQSMSGYRGNPTGWDIGTGVAGFCWAASNARAAVLLQHGVSEYAERYVDQYHHLIPHLNQLGLSVYAFDLEGHGRSPGRRVDTDVETSVLHHLAARACLATAALPVFLFGHSLGGLITATSVLRDPQGVVGVVLSAPALQVPAPPFLAALAPLLARWLPHLPVTRPDPNGISRVAARVQAAIADPLRYHGALYARLGASVLATSQANWARYPAWTTPVLVLHGTADRYTEMEGSRRFIACVSAVDKTLYLDEGGYHELLNDLGADRALQVVLDWFEARLRR
jgi:hypothetical protein